MSFTGWKVSEGKPYQYFPDAVAPLRLTTLTSLEPRSRSVVTAAVKGGGDPEGASQEWVIACLEGPSTLRIDLQFDSEVTFKVKGADVHFAGYHFWTGAAGEDDSEGESDDDDDEMMAGMDEEDLSEEGGGESDDSDGTSDSDSEEGSEDEPTTPFGGKSAERREPKVTSSEKKRLEWKTPIAEFSPAPGSGREKKEKGTAGRGTEERKRGESTDKALKTKEQQAAAKQGGKQAQQQASGSKSPAGKQPDLNKPQILPGGIRVTQLAMGSASSPVAKAGKRVSVRYVGRLAKNGKIFDQTRPGAKPFQFRLGAGEVIKGWDRGVAGMRIGERRRLVIPADLGYGKRGAPPDIPGNSALEFDVEVVDVK